MPLLGKHVLIVQRRGGYSTTVVFSNDLQFLNEAAERAKAEKFAAGPNVFKPRACNIRILEISQTILDWHSPD